MYWTCIQLALFLVNIFIPFVPGSSASVSEQFSSNGGRTGGTAVSRVADDLSVIVGKYESEGYEFQKIETIHVDVSPGCFGMLMGTSLSACSVLAAVLR